ncbi:pancreatic lipase-related protein 2-like [Liolophura sinensis]|uniref:pancreatic lipase-related protein 2-like n=1 Tax=Liolophura sinensis TaxID=3198878 RepID=UPI003158DE2B
MSNKLQIVFLGLLGVYSVQGWFFSNGEEKVCFVSPEQTCAAHTEFLLFTRENPKVPQNLTADETHTQEQRITESSFKGSRDTKFIIHGYTDKGDEGWAVRMAEKMIDFYDVNVICVNWQQSADNLFYGQAASNTRGVGETIASLVRDMVIVTDAEYTSFHLIGHSLGSHVAGFAGASLGGKIGRITGLDPAGPCFRFSGPERRLSEDDAIYVDAIHSDADNTMQAGFGTEVRMGDADFYPNGGQKQPGCDSYLWQHVGSLFTGWTSGFMKSLTCNHIRVLDLFEESIDPSHKFTSYPCLTQDDFKKCLDCPNNDCGRMGYHATTKERGIYTTITNGKAPFSKD